MKEELILDLLRHTLKEDYTIGKMLIDTKYFCDTLEDKVRDLNKNGKFDNGEVKVYGLSAIPYGEYIIDMDTVSPRLSKNKKYDFCEGKVPRLVGLKEFSGVLIHIGNFPKDTLGCILVGKNKIKGQLVESTDTFTKFYAVLLDAHKAGKTIKLRIA